METENFGDVVRAAAFGNGGMITRERHMFGPGALIAPVQILVQGTSVSAVSKLEDTSAKRTQAAVEYGAVSGLRSWRRHPV